MALDRLEVRVSITKLLVTLIIVIVPLSIVGLILTARSDKALDNTLGNNFKTVAELYGNEAAQFIRDRVADVNMMAAEPAVLEALSSAARRAGNQSGVAPAEAPAAKSVSTAAGKGTLGSNASELLRHRRELDPRFLALYATDQDGAITAASQKQTRASFAQEPDWQAAYNNGKGAVKISNILFDEFTKSYYVNMYAPVFDPASTRCIGVLSAAVNISTLLSRFQGQVGNGARVELVNDDGNIVSSPSADVFAHKRSQAFDGVRDSLGSFQGRQTGALTASLGTGGPYVIGFADTGLKQHYDNLGWIVIVSQEEHQAAAPMRQVEHFALLMVILGLLMLTLLCVYYYLHRAQRFSDIEGVLPKDEERTRAASA